jgi:glycosyltransferase involved in cell wall biosynthesis
MTELRVLLIADPFPIFGGAAARSSKVIPRLARQCDLRLLIPSRSIVTMARLGRLDEMDQILTKLVEGGVSVMGKTAELVEDLRDGTEKPKDPLNIVSALWDVASVNAAEGRFCDVDIVYSHHEGIQALRLLDHVASLNSAPCGVLLQLPPFRENVLKDLVWMTRNRSPRELPIIAPRLVARLQARAILNRLRRHGRLRFLFSVSSVSFSLSGLNTWGVRLQVLNPPTGTEMPQRAILRKQDTPAGDVLFYSRLVPEKGIFDLLKAWPHILSRHEGAQLTICGRFESPGIQARFVSELSRLESRDTVKLRGYVRDDELIPILRSAKLLLYPSHEDSFSLCVLEALTQGTPVVCFDIPAIREVYGGLPGVITVPEGDIASLASEAVEVLGMNSEGVYRLVNDQTVREVLSAHSSWDAIAAEELTQLERVVVSESTIRCPERPESISATSA